MISISFQTFGCKLNFSETTSISQKMKECGYNIVEDPKNADIHIIHSCTVTEHAEKKCRQSIRHAVSVNKDIKIIVMGCYAQLRPEEIYDLPNVIFVCGNETKFKLPEIIESITTNRINKDYNNNSHKFTYYPSISDDTRTRTFLKIQDGCDYFCTYCAVPYARGNSRSDTIANVVNFARQAVNSGKKEIVLSGVNLGDFGRKNGESFYQLMNELINIEKLYRIRISSIEPNLLEERILELTQKTDKIMPHFHIPLQSGSDRILKLMKRHYDTEFFLNKIQIVKQLMPLSCIAIDLITGFPGETNKDFEDTVNFLDSSPVSYLHVFSYSDRPEAAASHFTDKIPEDIILQRSKILHEFSDKKWGKFIKQNSGTTHKVLFEHKNREGLWVGWTDNYIETEYQSEENLHNEILEIKLDTGINLRIK